MATKKITPVNPDTKENDEVEAKDATAERKTAMSRIRKSGRRTSGAKCF